MVTQTIKLNLVPSGVMPVVYCTERDGGLSEVEAELYNGSEAFNASAYSVFVVGTKANNHSFADACTVSGNTVTFTISRQMTVYEGDILASLQISDGTNVIESLKFILSVKRSAVPDDIDLTDNDLSILSNMTTLVAAAEDAAERAEQAAGVQGDGTSVLEAADGTLSLGDASDGTVNTFTASAASFPVPSAAETIKVIMGKIVKFFADVKSAIGTLTDLTTTDQSSLVDAINEVDADVSANTTALANIGIASATSSTSVSISGSWASVVSISVDAGLYMFSGQIRFATVDAGQIGISIGTSADAISVYGAEVLPITTTETDVYFHIARAGQINSSTTIYINALGIGATVDFALVQAVRIK